MYAMAFGYNKGPDQTKEVEDLKAEVSFSKKILNNLCNIEKCLIESISLTQTFC